MISAFKRDKHDHALSDINVKTKYAIERITKGYCEYDLNDISSWFLQIVPNLIENFEKEMEGYVSNSFISYYLEKHFDKYNLTYKQYNQSIDLKKKDRILNICLKDYHKILKEISFNLNEANPDTCSKVNKYKEEYDIYEEKMWKINHKIMNSRMKHEKGGQMIRQCLNDNIDIIKKYRLEEKKLIKYRNRCKEKGLALFIEYFDYLKYEIL